MRKSKEPENILNHMARVCYECGSANFALLKSGGIECNKCGHRLTEEWGNFKLQIEQAFQQGRKSKDAEICMGGWNDKY